MKKIIAAAVATAFVAPAMAADVNISGLAEFYYQDANGTTSTGYGDHAVYIKASTETATGIAVSVDMNLTSEGEDDGSDSINLSGPFGTIELGDTSSATDKFDDRNDTDVVINAISLGADDAAIGWTLPTIAEGVTLYVSHTPDSVDNTGDGVSGSGFGLQYAAGPLSVAYATNEGDADTDNQEYVGASVSFGGFKISAEQLTDGASGAESKEKSVGLVYAMGDLTFSAAQEETTDDSDAVTADVTFMGIKYNLGGGVTAFVETSSDDRDADADTTAAGIAVAF